MMKSTLAFASLIGASFCTSALFFGLPDSSNRGLLRVYTVDFIPDMNTTGFWNCTEHMDINLPNGTAWLFSSGVDQGGRISASFSNSTNVPVPIVAATCNSDNCDPSSLRNVGVTILTGFWQSFISSIRVDHPNGVFGYSGTVYSVQRNDDTNGNNTADGWIVSSFSQSGALIPMFQFPGTGIVSSGSFNPDSLEFAVVTADETDPFEGQQNLLLVDVEGGYARNLTFNWGNITTGRVVEVQNDFGLYYALLELDNDPSSNSTTYAIANLFLSNLTAQILDVTPLNFTGYVKSFDMERGTMFIPFTGPYGNYEMYIGNPLLGLGEIIQLPALPEILFTANSSFLSSKKARQNLFKTFVSSLRRTRNVFGSRAETKLTKTFLRR